MDLTAIECGEKSLLKNNRQINLFSIFVVLWKSKSRIVLMRDGLDFHDEIAKANIQMNANRLSQDFSV
jgi:hypothetical protein